ncbi:DUF3558 family protein [Actinoplanes sp. NPDC049118]|uniref:DUF3558 family protein n=1 Tax=Actinoplanes sp. NPDC049118 TaxID=3155769 RepID=UPI00340E281E
MLRRPLAALVTVAALVALTGCGMLGDAPTSASDGAATPAPGASRTPGSDSGLGDSVKDSGDIPDPCTLLSRSEVTSLTGRDISQIDEDGLEDGDATRYCQWQQPGGQLAVFLSRTTEDEFKIKTAEATPVDGVGEDAFALAGHLYVLYGTVSIDVYSRGDSDEENLEKSETIAKVLIPRI